MERGRPAPESTVGGETQPLRCAVLPREWRSPGFDL